MHIETDMIHILWTRTNGTCTEVFINRIVFVLLMKLEPIAPTYYIKLTEQVYYCRRLKAYHKTAIEVFFGCANRDEI